MFIQLYTWPVGSQLKRLTPITKEEMVHQMTRQYMRDDLQEPSDAVAQLAGPDGELKAKMQDQRKGKFQYRQFVIRYYRKVK